MTAYRGKPLTAAIDPGPLQVAAAARAGELVICAGAGLSVADDASLPGGRELGRLLDEHLQQRLNGYVSPAQTSDLLAVADAAVEAAGGVAVLQDEVTKLAEFDQAAPNYGHRALALLLAEGAARTLLLWNWDNCVERSALEGERLEVARTLEDVAQLRVPPIAKVHGCITRVPTLLITSDQLANPPLWTEAAFRDAVHGTTAVFVGIGDVADYARRRLEDLQNEFPDLDVYVVSPVIVGEWESSVWAELLPELDAARRIEKTSDEFLDELARGWAVELPDRVVAVGGAVATGAILAGVDRAVEALRALSAVDLIAWARAAAFRCRIGQSAVRSVATQEAATAVGVLAGESGDEVRILNDGRCEIGSELMEIVVAFDLVTSTQVQLEAFRRVERLAGRGLLGDRAEILVAGAIVGDLESSPGVDVLEGAVDQEDVLRGPRGIPIRYTRSTDVVGRAA